MTILRRLVEALAQRGARLRAQVRRSLSLEPVLQTFAGEEFRFELDRILAFAARPPHPSTDSNRRGAIAVSPSAMGGALLRRARASASLSDDPASPDQGDLLVALPGGVGGIGGSLELSSNSLINELRSGLKVPPDPTLPPHVTALPRVGRAR